MASLLQKSPTVKHGKKLSVIAVSAAHQLFPALLDTSEDETSWS